MAEQTLSSTRAIGDDLERTAQGWLRWADAPDGWLSMLHAEIIAKP